MATLAFSELDTVVRELVALYRQAVKSAPADAAEVAAVSLARALEAIERVKRSSSPERAYEGAMADVAEAQEDMARLVGRGTRRREENA